MLKKHLLVVMISSLFLSYFSQANPSSKILEKHNGWTIIEHITSDPYAPFGHAFSVEFRNKALGQSFFLRDFLKNVGLGGVLGTKRLYNDKYLVRTGKYSDAHYAIVAFDHYRKTIKLIHRFDHIDQALAANLMDYYISYQLHLGEVHFDLWVTEGVDQVQKKLVLGGAADNSTVRIEVKGPSRPMKSDTFGERTETATFPAPDKVEIQEGIYEDGHGLEKKALASAGGRYLIVRINENTIGLVDVVDGGKVLQKIETEDSVFQVESDLDNKRVRVIYPRFQIQRIYRIPVSTNKKLVFLATKKYRGPCEKKLKN